MREFKSGKDYGKELAKHLREELLDRAVDEELVDRLCGAIQTFAAECWSKYLAGKRKTQYVTQTEFRLLYEQTVDNYVGDTINELLYEGKLTISVNRNGEIVYSLSDKGRLEGLL